MISKSFGHRVINIAHRPTAGPSPPAGIRIAVSRLLPCVRPHTQGSPDRCHDAPLPRTLIRRTTGPTIAESLPNLAAFFHRRWAVPTIVALAEGRGAKLVTLLNSVGATRPALRATLDDLIAQGYVERNPGYGHPMRPEYILTADGARLAPFSDRLLATVNRMDIEPLAFRKWTMPVTYALGSGSHRFTDLREELPHITPRALTLSLKDMQRAALVRRDVVDDWPPIATYRLDRRAQTLYRIVEPLAHAM